MELQTTAGPATTICRTITATALAGLGVGLVVVGGGGRLMMRIAGAAAPPIAQGSITEAGFRVGEVTAEGTIGLILFLGIFGGIASAVLHGVTRPWIEAAIPRGRVFLSGVLFVAVGSAISDLLNPDNHDFAILRRPLFTVALVLFLLWGIGATTAKATTMVERRLPDGSGARAGGIYLMFGLVSVPLSSAMLSTLFDRDACGCEPPWIAMASVVVMAIATAGTWVSAMRGTQWRWARVAGLLGLGGALVFGIARAASDAIAIVT